MNAKWKRSIKKKGARLFRVLLTLCMAATVLPALSMDAYAATGDAIQEGTAVLGTGANSANAATVYFGVNSGTPIAWRVIGYNDTGVASTDGNITLITTSTLGTTKFDNESTSNEYSNSDLRSAVDNIANGISDEEKTAVFTRTLAVSANDGENTEGIAGSEVADAVLWPLSTKEANAMSNDLRALDASNVDKGLWWWLRSPGLSNRLAAVVRGDGYVLINGDHVYDSFGVRPAFHLNLSSVLFISAVAGGKSPTVGNFATVGTNSGNEWKLTLKDTSRNSFDVPVADVAKTDMALYIKYANAKTGSGEYISTVVKNASGSLSHYAKLKALSDAGSASGFVTIGVGSIPSGTSHIYVFNEQDNGEKKTDYASDLKQVTIPANVDAYDLSANLTGLTSNGTPYAKMSADYSATLTPDAGYTLPANITVTVNGAELTAGTDYSYNQATGYLEIKKEKITGKIEIIAAGVGAGSVKPPSGPASGSVSATDNPQIERPDLWREFIKATLHKIEAAKEGETITIDFGGFNALTLSVMKQMAMRRDLTIKMVYCYKGAQYDLTFPAGMPINYSEDIPYYGPLKLADMTFRDGGVCILK